MDEYAGYQPIIDALSDDLGVPVELHHTGGGCMALLAEEVHGAGGRYEILITDAEDTLSPWNERVQAEADGHRYGYLVGVYPADGGGSSGEALGYLSGKNSVSPDDVVALVRGAVLSVDQGEGRR